MSARTSARLPEGFAWDIGDRRRTKILISGKGVRKDQVAVRSLDAGTGWATRWMLERQTALIRAVHEQAPRA